jgi:hypothetical protein
MYRHAPFLNAIIKKIFSHEKFTRLLSLRQNKAYIFRDVNLDVFTNKSVF